MERHNDHEVFSIKDEFICSEYDETDERFLVIEGVGYAVSRSDSNGPGSVFVEFAMKVADLPRLGIINNPSGGEFFGEWTDLTGKDLLCLGFTEWQIDEFIAPYRPSSVTMLTYWSDHIDASSAKYRLIMGDITQRTGFKDGEFDAVLTMSVLEHVSDLGAAFNEMARIARTEMLHMFGPAWSCAYGHHLYAHDDDPNLNFVKWQMPAHMHLLCNEQEICDYYESLGYGREAGQFVYDQFHANGHINRIFYDDYVPIFHRFQVERMETMFNRLPTAHLGALREAYPDRGDFSTYGGRYKLLV